MKKLAAHDFEDLLQCSIPAFAGLLPPPHNNRVLKLLYVLTEWHALAKLRLHTDTTLKQLEQQTTELGQLMRDFERLTCVAFETFELPRETAARVRHQAQASASASTSTAAAAASTATTSARKAKKFNLNIYKFHSLGDYVNTIREFGTTDSYSTQIVSW